MGGGFMYSGPKSTSFTAVRPPPFPLASGATRGCDAHHPLCSEPSSFSASSSVSASDHGFIFGPVPSRVEVERAISDLQRFMNELSTSESELDQTHGLMHHGKMMQAPGFAKFYDAFHVMQTEPAVQSMVISISCDKAVWEAIQNNKAIQDLQGSIPPVRDQRLLSSVEDQTDISVLILKWIMGFTKSKIIELIEKFGSIVNDIIQPAPKEKPTSELTDLLEEKIRSSLLLSVVILLIVVVTRSQG